MVCGEGSHYIEVAVVQTIITIGDIPMPGTINWIATFSDGGTQPSVQIYDNNGNVVKSMSIHCVPPIMCPIPMENVQFGKYKAALASGSNRYYYVEGQAIITVPNDAASATVINLTQQNPTAQVNINVQPGQPT